MGAVAQTVRGALGGWFEEPWGGPAVVRFGDPGRGVAVTNPRDRRGAAESHELGVPAVAADACADHGADRIGPPNR